MANNIAFVILHYNDYEMTANYIAGIKKLNWENINHKIIIVDNASPDGSGMKLKEKFVDDSEVEVLLSQKNEGFARGNNIGILYANRILDNPLVVISNNDIFIKDRSFPLHLISIHNKEKFAVYGPDIYSLSKKIHQNPLKSKPYTESEIHDLISKLDSNLKKLKVIDSLHIYNFLRFLKKMLRIKTYVDATDFDRVQINVVLHGAFFVLSQEYFKCFPDGLFDKTFLYMEENILAYRCKLNHLKTYYDPTINVIHFDGISSISAAGDRCKKFIKEEEETRNSCKIFLEYINSMKGM